jgi:succinate dehydrogenase/fumarate reductase cytochrome b subunit
MLLRIQAASGLVFAVFLFTHLFNTWLAALGPGWYDAFQRPVGAVYQWLPVEILILSAVLVHLVCAVLRWRGLPAGQGRGALSARQRLHRYSGIFLMIVIGGHVAAVRFIPAWYGIRPEALGVSFTFQFLPVFFYPYYLLLAVCGFYHAANGMAVAASRFGFRFPLNTPTLYLLGVGATVLTLLALLGFGGWIYEVGDAFGAPFARLVLELIGERPRA